MRSRRYVAALGAFAAAVVLIVCWASGVGSAAGTLRQGSFSGRVRIVGGRRLHLECRGRGSPTVVLEAGAGDSGREWLAHGPGLPAVMPAVARFTRVCVYDRPGTYWPGGFGQPKSVSRSDPVAMPRTVRDMVLDLHALLHAPGTLRAAGVRGPVVFAGFSFGGMVVRLYATTYPREVAGLVLIDSQTEWDLAGLKRLLTREQYTNAFVFPPPLPGFENHERPDVEASAAEMRQAQADTPLRRMPLVVLSHSPTAPNPLGWPSDYPIRALNQAFNASQDKLTALVPGARHVIARKSPHEIGLYQPKLVIDAIRSVVERARRR